MNKRQREVIQIQLDNEKAVLKQLENSYQDALDEINSKIELLMSRQDADMQHVIYQVEYQKALKMQIQAILEQLQNNEFETLSEYLTQAYEDGFIGTMYDLQGQGIPLVMPIDQEQVVAAIQHETQLSANLYNSLDKDIKLLQKQIAGEISRGISTGMMYQEIARNISSYAGIGRNKAMRIARTEAHRIQCKAASDAQWKAKEKGADVVKVWDSTLDSKTRKRHAKLDGQIRELDEPFEVDGHKAMFPGDFGRPEEDINCRCAILQKARWALDESELNTLKERAEYFGLDKTKDFDDYKSRYLDATIPKTSAIVKDNLREYSEDEIKEIAENTNKIVNKHIENASKWSGNIVVDDNSVEYGKLWNCDIKTISNTAPHIILHEQIHAHSISYYDAQTYSQYHNIEEASVQLMAQEISKIEGIIIIESQYDDMVDVLKNINKSLNLYDNNYDFAKKLIEMPVTDRIAWIEEQASESMMKGGTIEQYQKVSDLIELIS